MKTAVSLEDISVWRSNTFQLQIKRLRLRAGNILCITGANGSGKTTLIESLAGILQPQGGTIKICGNMLSNDLRATKAQIGFIPDDEAWFVRELCAEEYFDLLRHIYRDAGVTADMQSNCKRLGSALQFTAMRTPLKSLSHGNKKKVQIIAGLMHEPAVIIIDELRNGLDPLAIIAVEEIVLHEAARGACIIAATHDLWWAERIAKEIMLLHNGRVAVQDSTSQLLEQYGSLESLFKLKATGGVRRGNI